MISTDLSVRDVVLNSSFLQLFCLVDSRAWIISMSEVKWKVTVKVKGPLGLKLAPHEQGTFVLAAGNDKAPAVGLLFSSVIRSGRVREGKPQCCRH